MPLKAKASNLAHTVVGTLTGPCSWKRVDIINFDAVSFTESMTLYAEKLLAYLQGGGSLAWEWYPIQIVSGKKRPPLW